MLNLFRSVSWPTGTSNRARPAARPADQPGRPSVHEQDHGQPEVRSVRSAGITVYRI